MKGQKSSKKVIVGITGSFGSGKTTVAKIFRLFGTKVIDADKIAHAVMRPKTKTYQKIIHAFGRGILKSDKAIDRRKLAAIVFSDKALLIRLNKIVHPEVIQVIKKEIKVSPHKFIVLDAALLIEAGLRGLVDKLIVVKTTKKKQIERILAMALLSRRDISRRIKAQLPLRQKARMADFVIDNSGTIKETRRQAERIWKTLQLTPTRRSLAK